MACKCNRMLDGQRLHLQMAITYMKEAVGRYVPLGHGILPIKNPTVGVNVTGVIARDDIRTEDGYADLVNYPRITVPKPRARHNEFKMLLLPGVDNWTAPFAWFTTPRSSSTLEKTKGCLRRTTAMLWYTQADAVFGFEPWTKPDSRKQIGQQVIAENTLRQAMAMRMTRSACTFFMLIHVATAKHKIEIREIDAFLRKLAYEWRIASVYSDAVIPTLSLLYEMYDVVSQQFNIRWIAEEHPFIFKLQAAGSQAVVPIELLKGYDGNVRIKEIHIGTLTWWERVKKAAAKLQIICCGSDMMEFPSRNAIDIWKRRIYPSMVSATAAAFIRGGVDVYVTTLLHECGRDNMQLNETQKELLVEILPLASSNIELKKVVCETIYGQHTQWNEIGRIYRALVDSGLSSKDEEEMLYQEVLHRIKIALDMNPLTIQ